VHALYVLQEMTEAQTYSWIFYALAAIRNCEGAGFRDIESVADGINHAVPTQKEITSSLSWAESKGLIEKTGKKIFLTDSGRVFAARFFETPGSAMKTWDRIASAFADMGADNSIQLDCRTMMKAEQ
jgi:superfamily II helicase